MQIRKKITGDADLHRFADKLIRSSETATPERSDFGINFGFDFNVTPITNIDLATQRKPCLTV